MVRLFVAIDLPAGCKSSASGIIDELSFKGLKRVEPDLLHITLKFLGEVPDKNVAGIIDALSEVRCKPIDVVVKGAGAFPNLKRIRVIWITAEGDFRVLPKAIDGALLPLGFPRETREFTAHITVARVKQYGQLDYGKVQEVINRFSGFEFGRFSAGTFTLKQSTLTPKGPIYQTLKEFRLDGE